MNSYLFYTDVIRSRYNDCGGDTVQFPQLTIYDSLHAANVPFAIYVNDTCGPQTNMSCGSVDPGWGTSACLLASSGCLACVLLHA
jgi:hypothetical protein